MKWHLILVACAACLALVSCGKPHDYEASVKQLDSLKVVVEQSLDNFSTLDSAAYYNALCRQTAYSGFVQQRVQDTIKKQDAVALQTMYGAGKTFKAYFASRRAMIMEANTSVSQLKKLSDDLTNDAVAARDAIGYINEEKKEAEKIIGLLKSNTDALRRQMEAYNRALPIVEALVKRYNNDQLPTPVKPEI